MQCAGWFDDIAQQRESYSLGMWLFLATEVMMFGGLFFAYSFYRWKFEAAFHEGSSHLDTNLGTLNTFVLLFSSWTMALAVHAASTKNRGRLVFFLILTWLLGAAFITLMPIFLEVALTEANAAFNLNLGPGVTSMSQLLVFGGLIIFFLIVEPHGLARLWQIAKEKLRLWPFPH